MEPLISIFGTDLTQGQAMTIRVALEIFASDLAHEGLGNDEIGQAITNGYLERIKEIRQLMYPPR